MNLVRNFVIVGATNLVKSVVTAHRFLPSHHNRVFCSMLSLYIFSRILSYSLCVVTV